MSTTIASPIARPTGGIFDRIKPLAKNDTTGMKVVLYGRAKTGKTRLISTFPKPILILGAEDGTRSIRGIDNTDFVRIVLNDADASQFKDNYIRLTELEQLLTELRTVGHYATVAVDTASALADLILADILGLDKVPEQKGWAFASRQQYGAQALQVKTILKAIIDLPVHSVITAHERNFNEEGGEDSELIAPTVGSALSPSVAGWLNGAVEYICQTFIRKEMKVSKSKIGGEEIETSLPTGKMEYCLRVGPHPIYVTGFRLPLNGQELPESGVIVQPTFEKLAKLIY